MGYIHCHTRQPARSDKHTPKQIICTPTSCQASHTPSKRRELFNHSNVLLDTCNKDDTIRGTHSVKQQEKYTDIKQSGFSFNVEDADDSLNPSHPNNSPFILVSYWIYHVFFIVKFIHTLFCIPLKKSASHSINFGIYIFFLWKLEICLHKSICLLVTPTRASGLQRIIRNYTFDVIVLSKIILCIFVFMFGLVELGEFQLCSVINLAWLFSTEMRTIWSLSTPMLGKIVSWLKSVDKHL